MGSDVNMWLVFGFFSSGWALFAATAYAWSRSRRAGDRFDKDVEYQLFCLRTLFKEVWFDDSPGADGWKLQLTDPALEAPSALTRKAIAIATTRLEEIHGYAGVVSLKYPSAAPATQAAPRVEPLELELVRRVVGPTWGGGVPAFYVDWSDIGEEEEEAGDAAV